MPDVLLPAEAAFYQAALNEAKKGLAAGGIPIGSVLVYDNKIIGRGHNQRVQKKSAILHGEMAAFEDAGRLPATIYEQCTLYTTLSPCAMCTGTAILYKIPKIIIGENHNFRGDEGLLKAKGIQLIILNDPETIQIMKDFIEINPSLWNEDIGENA